jgi:hypothetical protein
VKLLHSLAAGALAAGLLSTGCGGSPTAGDGVAVISGRLTCADGRAVGQGRLSIHRGQPLYCGLDVCDRPNPVPLLAETRSNANGHFELALALNGSEPAGALWILGRASGDFCGSGYNFRQQPLGAVRDGEHVQLTVVIEPFVT